MGQNILIEENQIQKIQATEALMNLMEDGQHKITIQQHFSQIQTSLNFIIQQSSKLETLNKALIYRIFKLIHQHYDPRNTLIKLLHLFMLEMNKFNKYIQRDTFLFVPNQKIQSLLIIGQFLILISDKQTLNLSRLLVNHKNTEESFSIETSELKQSEVLFIIAALIKYILSVIKMKQQIFKKSEHASKRLDHLSQICFMIILKIFFSSHNSTLKTNGPITQQLIIISGYFILSGIDQLNIPIFESGILLLSDLLSEQIELIQVVTFSSYLFKKIPIFQNSSLFQDLVMHLLYAINLTEINSSFYQNFNIIGALRLILIILNLRQVDNIEIQVLLEQLIVKLNPKPITSIFLHQINKIYILYSRSKKIISEILLRANKTRNNIFYVKIDNQEKLKLKFNIVLDILTTSWIYGIQFKNVQAKYQFNNILKVDMNLQFSQLLYWKIISDTVVNKRVGKQHKSEEFNRTSVDLEE